MSSNLATVPLETNGQSKSKSSEGKGGQGDIHDRGRRTGEGADSWRDGQGRDRHLNSAVRQPHLAYNLLYTNTIQKVSGSAGPSRLTIPPVAPLTESQRKPLRQRLRRELHQDSQNRGSSLQRIRHVGRGAGPDRRFHRTGLQSQAAPLGVRVRAARGVRRSVRGGRDGGLTPPEFSRQGRIYRSDPVLAKTGCGTEAAPRAHRFDESAAGYSSAGCSPAEPASASPAAAIVRRYAHIGKLFSANSNLSLLSWPHQTTALHP